MKKIALLPFFLAAPLWAEVTAKQPTAADLAERAEELAIIQDELSADVMELVEDQTVPEVIELLEEVETIMVEVTDSLIDSRTGGETIAAETEIIEKIFAAAQQKQQSSEGSQQSLGAMLDMMERMMGREPSDKPGEQPGSAPGKGREGESESENSETSGSGDGEGTIRTVPKGSGPAGGNLPSEFRRYLDAYNRTER